MPRHVAMIFDGNRRWARQRGLETAAHGHSAGALKIHEFLSWCDQLDISVVTLYLLSGDNLVNRDNEELDQLFDIIAELSEDLAATADWRVQQVGTSEGLPQSLIDAMHNAEVKTANNTGLHINLAVGYGGRREIADAVRSIVTEHNSQGGTLDDLAGLLTPELIAELSEDLAATADWRVQQVGTTDGLPQSLVDAMRAAEVKTANNTGLHINLAVGYGGRREIADAVRSIVTEHNSQGGTLDDLAALLTPELIAEHLYTQGQPDPDLVIRTSGEQRLSDFMLWQSAHSEFYFVEALGPDLREVDFLRALRDYAKRQRRFGS